MSIDIGRRPAPDPETPIIDAGMLYFVHSDELVVIVGIWGATRRTTPRFADRFVNTKAALAATDRATTTPGFVNRNGQEVVKATDLPGTDHLLRTRR
jgi:hypothetical protein